MKTPLDRYREDLQRPEFVADSAQALAVEHLQRMFLALAAADKKTTASWRTWFSFGTKAEMPTIKGLYLWGGVGRGKTYLMDIFYECLPFENKMRTHFHRFMRHIHAQLKELKGWPDPLELVAERLAKKTRIICFDEFFVADITDAMLLANLLRGLFARGVTLVTTSNVEPLRLYENGLQRKNFLPAIELLIAHTEVVFIDSPTDYRLRALDKAELYYHPPGPAADAHLQRCFLTLAPTALETDIEHESGSNSVTLEVEGRPIIARRETEDVVWFEFAAICDGPRSQTDYIELAKEYHAVLVSDVPIFNDGHNDQARRFINLVDVFYDRNVKLVLSAAAPLEHLYQGSVLRFEFARTSSRLIEMQSHEYLARPHMP